MVVRAAHKKVVPRAFAPPFLRGKNRRYISMAGPIPQKQNWGQVKYSRPSFLDTLASWAERAGADAEKLS
jgi:hypothetical protein